MAIIDAGAPIRVLYLHAEREFGGAGQSLKLLLEHLPSSRYQPVVVLPGQGSFATFLKEKGIPVYFEPLMRFPAVTETFFYREARFKTLRLLKEIVFLLLSLQSRRKRWKSLIQSWQPDIIHINSVTLIAEGWALSGSKVPLVWHIHDIFSHRWIGQWAGNMIPEWANAVIAVSKAAGARLNASRGNVHVIYNGIDLREWQIQQTGTRTRVRQELGLPPDAPCIGFLGRLTAAKGFFDLVQAAPRILAHFPNTHFLIVGSEPTKGNWMPSLTRTEVSRLNLGNYFHFVGQQRNVKDFIEAMDIVALPSWSEGFGYTVVETMAMGKAVVASNATAMPELIVHGETGLLVEPHNPSQLADACLQFLKNKELALSCGKNAVCRVQRFFSADVTARNIENIYQELLKETKKI